MPLAGDGYGLLSIADVDPPLLAGFTCGKEHLDEFLRTEALTLHKQRLGFTSVVFHRDLAGPVAYFTLAHDAIGLRDSERFELGLDPGPVWIPAVKLCRLGVSSGLQSGGVGTAVVDLMFGQLLDARYPSMARLMVVDADNEDRVIRFYERSGFERSLWAEDQATRAARGKTPQRPAAVKMLRDILAT